MMSSICPHCSKKIPIEKLKGLRNNRAILCPSCTKGVRIKQKNMVLTVGIFSGAMGIISKEYFGITLIDGVIIMIIFAVCYSFIYLNFVGMYFPLEKAQDEDLLL